MLFERTCRIAQDFDWFLRFVPQNSVEKRKNSKNHPENCTKNRQHDSFACLFWDVRTVKGSFHASFCDSSESHRQRCTVPIKMPKSTRIIQKTAQKTGSTILSPACLGMFEPSKAFSMFLFMMPANQAASHCNQNQNANDQRCHLPVAFP